MVVRPSEVTSYETLLAGVDFGAPVVDDVERDSVGDADGLGSPIEVGTAEVAVMVGNSGSFDTVVDVRPPIGSPVGGSSGEVVT